MKKSFILLSVLFLFSIPTITHAQVITTIAGIISTTGYSGDGGMATLARFNHPAHMAFDSTGAIYVSDFGANVIRKIDAFGIVTTIAGNGTSGYSGDGGLALAATLSTPNGVASDVLGNIYIADQGNNVIRKINSAGIISTIAGNGIQGYSGDGGAATNAMLHTPSGVSIDASGNIYIADALNQRVRKINTSGIITTYAGIGVAGFSGDGGQATNARIHDPVMVNLDVAGNMYLSDQQNNRVRKITTSGIITTIAGNGIIGYSGDGGPATLANFNIPSEVSIDDSGNIIIVDSYNNVIRKVNSMGIITTIAGNGASGNTGDGGPATAAEFNQPWGVSIDRCGGIYITDAQNNVVRKISNSPSTPYLSNIIGLDTICYPADLAINYADSTSGGIWSSTDTSKATISATGILTTKLAGIDTIVYSIATPCMTNSIKKAIYLIKSPAVSPLTGPAYVCIGDSITLMDTVVGGNWLALNYKASVSPTGTVFGVAHGLDTINYSISNYCGTAKASKIISVFTTLECDSILSVSITGLNNNSLLVFPNPTNGDVSIQFTSNIPLGNLQLINEFGEVIINKTIDESIAELNISNLAHGWYFLKVFNGGNYICKKILKD